MKFEYLTSKQYEQILHRFNMEFGPITEIKFEELHYLLLLHVDNNKSDYILAISSIWIKNKDSFKEIKKQAEDTFGFNKLKFISIKNSDKFSSYEDLYSFRQSNMYDLHVSDEYEKEDTHFICLLATT